MNPRISAYCHIKSNRVYLNGKLIYRLEEEIDRQEFMKAAFRNTDTKYPKFFKMDDYSKLGFLASEVLLSSLDPTTTEGQSTGIILSNSQSTLITDQQFQDSIQSDNNFFPSPSVFVYTLPNIMAGEIAIRHHFYGENAFFVSSSFDSDWQSAYVNQLMASNKLSSCISGWVDINQSHYEAFLYFVTSGENGNKVLHTPERIKELYSELDK